MKLRHLTTAAGSALVVALFASPVAAQSARQGPSTLESVVGGLLDAFTPDQVRRLPIDDRQAWIEGRIEAGVRDGTLNRAEARRLRADFDEIARLERSYQRNGLSYREQAELDRRFDRLSAQVYQERADGKGRWAAINERQRRLDERIDTGVRQGDLTRAEAQGLRRDFQSLARLEARYRNGGLSGAERVDLDRRFDALSARIRDERHDRQQRTWVSVNDRQQELDRRIDAGIRDGSLTAREGEQLHADFRAIARLETRYRRNGLSALERADLDARLDVLRNRIRSERYDRQANVR